MIRRYFATKDNTITNAFEENLTTRGTGSNMGAADIVEVFSIYNQVSNSSGISSELARTLIEFDVSNISSDRTAGLIPASGSVSWFLNMYNAPHSQTVPSNFTLSVQGISGSWEEGFGIDMDFYEDKTRDNVGSNWINAQQRTAATATITAASPGSLLGGATFTLTNAAGTTTTYRINGGGTYSSQTGGNAGDTIDLFVGGASTVAHIAEAVTKVINETTNADMTATNDGTNVTVTQTTKGTAGNRTNTDSSSGLASVGNFEGALGQWTNEGGDFYTDTSSSFTQTFSTGLEDLSVDVTTLVEQWINSGGNVLGSKSNNGFAIKLTNALETSSKSYFRKKFFGRDTEFFFQRPVLEARWDSARKDDRGYFYASSSLASATDNLNTLYLYNRIRGRLRDIPVPPTGATLRASATGADLYTAPVSRESTGIYKADLFLNTTSSTLYDVWHSGSKASTVLTFGSGIPSNGPLEITFGQVGTFTLTFDNTTGSTDADIGSDNAATIDPSVEIDSAGNAQRVLLLLRDGVTGDGIKNSYNFAYDGSSSGAETVTITSKETGASHNITVTESLNNISSTVSDGSTVAYHTGTIEVKTFAGYGYNPEDIYFISMPGLRKEYKKNQTHRLNLYVREKNWSPNIHTIATRTSIPSLIIPSASFQLRRSIDDYVVIPYGTGSTSHTGLSYDVSGNYFDLDTTYLEAGYLYQVQYSFYDEENGWEEQPYRFKFRVVN